MVSADGTDPVEASIDDTTDATMAQSQDAPREGASVGAFGSGATAAVQVTVGQGPPSVDSIHAASSVAPSGAAGMPTAAQAVPSSTQPLTAGDALEAAAAPSAAPSTHVSSPSESIAGAVTANDAVISSGQQAQQASQANGNAITDAAELRAQPRATGTATSASTKRASTGTTPADALAQLMESASAAIELIAQRGGGKANGSALAGRLADVEAAIARDRMAREIDATGATLSADTAVGEAASAGDPTRMLPNTSTNPNTIVGAQHAFPTPAVDALGGAVSASSAPAADLLSSGDPEVPPAAHLAAKGAGILASQRGGSITMRLEPPALGQLRIQLQISQGAVVADFTAATPEARLLLESHVGMLRERLESQGLTVERISVHGGRGTDSAPVTTAQQSHESRSDGSDARERSDRGQGRQEGRQDAAGGESRGRRDGDGASHRARTEAQWKEGRAREFAGVLEGESVARAAEPVRRAG